MVEQEKDLSAFEIKDLAIRTLTAVCNDPEAGGSARAQAARTLCEICNLIGKNAEPERDLTGKELSSMTAQELDAEIRRLSRKSP